MNRLDEVLRNPSDETPTETRKQRRAETKFYNLAIPKLLYERLVDVAKRNGTSLVEVIRKFLAMGLYVSAELERPGVQLVLREGTKETLIKVF